MRREVQPARAPAPRADRPARLGARRPRPESSTWARGWSSRWSRPRPTRSSTSITSRSFPPTRPRRPSSGSALGFAPTGDGRLEVGGAWLELLQGDPGDPERPLLNHIGVLVDSVEEHQARGRGARRRDRRRRRRAEHARAVRLGPGPREARVHRAQAIVQPDLVVAGAGMAGLVAAARARELGAAPVVLEKGNRPGGSMLLSSGVVWRHHSLEDFQAECPGGDVVVAAPDRRGARRRARLAGVARRRAAGS